VKPTLSADLAGWLAGLRLAPSLLRRPRGWGTAPAGQFLAGNPYPRPRTDGLFYREKMRAIHRVAPAAVVESVLEVGGGQSALTSLLYPGARVVNVEVDAAYATSAATTAAGLRFVAGDATALPVPDATFDVVTFFDVLEHIPRDGVAAAEAVRVLRPGGSLLVSSPNEHWRFPYHRAFRRFCPTDGEVMAEWGHVRRCYDTPTLEALVGWPIEAWATFISPVTVLAHDLGFARLPRRVRRLLRAAVAPVAWTGYALHHRHARGTETVWAWRKGA
jgi:SAM-dependent methyltransferase